MKKIIPIIFFSIILAQPEPEEIIFGYLRASEVSVCMDECGEYYVEHEFQDGPPTAVIFMDGIDMSMYIDRFVRVTIGNEVPCITCNAFDVEDIQLSDDCMSPVLCIVDPCEVAPECQVNTPTECVSNYCGGCYADFYDLNGNLVDCTLPVEECSDLDEIFFGYCDMYLGVAIVDGVCSYMSGCGWDVDGVDYSDAFFETIYECEEVCYDNSCDVGDVSGDGAINVIDIVQIVTIILGIEEPTDEQLCAGDMNQDGELNVLDIVQIVQIILNPEDSIIINSGTSYGECFGYCIYELEIDNGDASFTVGDWYPTPNYPELNIEENLNEDIWNHLLDLVDFDYFQSLDDVYGCPDCADGGSEWIEIIYNGVSKQVTFEAYTNIAPPGMEELTIMLRDMRDGYWEQLNNVELPEECYLEPETGPCFGYIPKYFFNQDTGQCEQFIWGGCAGVVPFDTLYECENACE